jgi:Flp pilus assembly protein TadB
MINILILWFVWHVFAPFLFMAILISILFMVWLIARYRAKRRWKRQSGVK